MSTRWIAIGLLSVLFAGCSAEAEPDAPYDGEPLGTTEHGLTSLPAPLRDAPMCGGIAAIRCPGQGHCVDDPSDACDPRAGGADCSGLCVCKPRIACRPGTHFERSPHVCACVPDLPDACTQVLCKPGTHCIEFEGEPVCVPGITPL